MISVPVDDLEWLCRKKSIVFERKSVLGKEWAKSIKRKVRYEKKRRPSFTAEHQPQSVAVDECAILRALLEFELVLRSSSDGSWIICL